MRTNQAALGTLAFAASVPATVVGVIPSRLAGRRRGDPFSSSRGQRVTGLVAMTGGLALVTDAFVRFVRARGTPAPVAETEQVVTTGPYAITRNPQYVGVVATVVGESLLWGSRRVGLYALALFVAFDIWVRVYEEPRLRHRFGTDYERYAERVPRWLRRPSVA